MKTKISIIILFLVAAIAASQLIQPKSMDILDAQCEPLADTTLPAGYPAGVPVYPNSTRVQASILPVDEHGESGKNMFFVIYCTSDSQDKVADYFLKNSSGWNIKDTGQIQTSIPEFWEQKILEGKKSGHDLTIDIDGTKIEGIKSKTVIKYQIPIK